MAAFKPDPYEHPHKHYNDSLAEAGVTENRRLCGTTTIVNRKYIARLFCGRKDCPVCYDWRVNKVVRRVATGQVVKNTELHFTIFNKTVKAAVAKKLYRAQAPYLMLPQANDLITLVVFNDGVKALPERTLQTLDDTQLHKWFETQLQTPDNERISFSRNWPRLADEEKETTPVVDDANSETYWTSMSVDKVSDLVEQAGGVVTWSNDFNSGKHDLSNSQWQSFVDALIANSSSVYKIEKGQATKIYKQRALLAA